MIEAFTKFSAIVHYKQFGGTVRHVARKYGVSKSSVSRWVNDDPGCVKIKRLRRKRKSAVKTLSKFIVQSMETSPFLTAKDLVVRVSQHLGVSVSESTISRCRKAYNYRFKRTQRSQEVQRVDRDHPFMEPHDPYEGSITLDESSFVSIDGPIMGWARGSRRVPKGPPTRRKRISLLLAIDANGVVDFDVREGAFKGDTYAAFLSKLPTHRTIIADNCNIHKTGAVKSVAEARHQTLMYTPPYCPWFNPVEFAFPKIKNAYRRARLEGRADFVLDVNDALAGITPADCSSFFEHSRRVRQIELSKILAPA